MNRLNLGIEGVGELADYAESMEEIEAIAKRMREEQGIGQGVAYGPGSKLGQSLKDEAAIFEAARLEWARGKKELDGIATAADKAGRSLFGFGTAAETSAEQMSLISGMQQASDAYQPVLDAQGAFLAQQEKVNALAAKKTTTPDTTKWGLFYGRGIEGGASDQVLMEETEKLLDLKEAYNEANDANVKWWKQYIFTALSAKLAGGEEGLTPEEGALLIGVGEKFGLIDPEIGSVFQEIFSAIGTADPSDTDKILQNLEDIFKKNNMTINIHTINTITTIEDEPIPPAPTTPEDVQGGATAGTTAGEHIINNYGTINYNLPKDFRIRSMRV